VRVHAYVYVQLRFIEWRDGIVPEITPDLRENGEIERGRSARSDKTQRAEKRKPRSRSAFTDTRRFPSATLIVDSAFPGYTCETIRD